MQKRILRLFLSLLFVFTITGCSSANATSNTVSTPMVQKNVFIYDSDFIIDEDIEERLNQTLVQLYEITGITFYVLTVPNLSETSINNRQYADIFISSLISHNIDENNSMVLLLSRSKNSIEVRIGNTLKRFVSEDNCNSLLTEQCDSSLENRFYSQAVETSISVIMLQLSEVYDLSSLNLNLSVTN